MNLRTNIEPQIRPLDDNELDAVTGGFHAFGSYIPTDPIRSIPGEPIRYTPGEPIFALQPNSAVFTKYSF